MVGGRGWGGECGCAGGACVRDDYSNYRLFDDEAVVQHMNQLFSVHYSNTIVLHCAVLMALLLCLKSNDIAANKNGQGMWSAFI